MTIMTHSHASCSPVLPVSDQLASFTNSADEPCLVGLVFSVNRKEGWLSLSVPTPHHLFNKSRRETVTTRRVVIFCPTKDMG